MLVLRISSMLALVLACVLLLAAGVRFYTDPGTGRVQDIPPVVEKFAETGRGSARRGCDLSSGRTSGDSCRLSESSPERRRIVGPGIHDGLGAVSFSSGSGGAAQTPCDKLLPGSAGQVDGPGLRTPLRLRRISDG